ncbi:MAG: sigma-70 family RNA polymerase sigma factor [Chloroflexi bacterium]|nr:sigma-70 family RNA polymerase sigma factor [Chloroflexota bacterium]
MTLSDETLLSQYKEGNPRAFRALVQRYTTPIYNLALRLLRDPMEAENVTQETFLRVVTALDRIRLDLPFKPYLFQIAVNLCRDQARKQHPLLFTDLDGNSILDADGEAETRSESIADEAPPAWERLEKQELLVRLQTAMDLLAPAYQTAITLRYVEEFSYEEIAQALALPLNTVRTQLRRAKHQLKLNLENEPRPAPQPYRLPKSRSPEGGLA